MSDRATDFESLLREAFAPVEPPADLAQRVESTLVSLTELAADELEAWELSSIHDPRNWVRPAAAVVVGTTAGAALVLVRARRRSKQRTGALGGIADTAERAARDVASAARDVADEARRIARGG
jgi:hypothetical protein